MPSETSATSSSWQKRVESKRAALSSLIPPEWIANVAKQAHSDPDARAREPDALPIVRSSLDASTIELTEMPLTILLERLASGALSSVDLTTAFCKRAAVAHQLVNCLSEVFFDAALKRAAELDAHLSSTGKVVGPLHGLPVSFKDAFRVEGVETGVGFVAWLDGASSAEDESALVKQVRSLGAVPFVKTAVPTSLMAIETDSNICGYTFNGRNRQLSSGGSSGGEAALLSLRGSPLGWGTDIGGSIRLPAAFNGIWGLRPSHGRLAGYGVRQSMNGQSTVPSVVGPLAPSLEALQTGFAALLQGDSLPKGIVDPTVVSIPWRQHIVDDIKLRASKRSLSFGVLRFDGIVKPLPPVVRALESAVAALKAQGHEVIEWDPPAHGEGFGIIWDVFAQDGGDEIHATAALSGESLVPAITGAYGATPGTLKALSLAQVWALHERKQSYQARYDAYWASTASKTSSGLPVDALLMPPAPTPAWVPGTGMYPGYTAVLNVLDYSTLIVPTGQSVDAEQDAHTNASPPVGDMDAQVAKSYDAKVMHGAPLAVQLLGQRTSEEKVLALGAVLESALAAHSSAAA